MKVTTKKTTVPKDLWYDVAAWSLIGYVWFWGIVVIIAAIRGKV